jgi:hypothetical protein
VFASAHTVAIPTQVNPVNERSPATISPDAGLLITSPLKGIDMTEQDNKYKTLQDHPYSEESIDEFHADQMRFSWLGVAISVATTLLIVTVIM